MDGDFLQQQKFNVNFKMKWKLLSKPKHIGMMTDCKLLIVACRGYSDLWVLGAGLPKHNNSL